MTMLKGVCNSTTIRGFTLIELVVVIIILGVMAVGISGFISLTTQTYLNVSERDELLSNARFVIERLNREVRGALPNSVRQGSSGNTQCLEFVPISASTVYLDIPVSPEASSNTLRVIPFIQGASINLGSDYISVYPLASDGADIYDHSRNKVFTVANYTVVTPDKEATIVLAASANFAEDSPTRRAYIVKTPVAYCINGDAESAEIHRYSGYAFTANPNQAFPPAVNVQGKKSLMANGLSNIGQAFTIESATLRRNAVVKVELNFVRDEGEVIVFDNAIHITNVP